MIKFSSLRQYTNVTDGIRFPNTSGNNFIITYFPENSNLLEDYPKLNFKLIDSRINVIPLTKIPRTRLTPALLKSFKNLGIMSYPSTTKIPPGKNLFYDLSTYLKAIDSTYNPINYRQRLNIFIKNIVNQSYIGYENFQKVLLYTIDITKPNINKFVDRKIFPIVQQLKDNSFEFDHLVFCLITHSGPKYRLLVKDKKFKLEKVIVYLKSIKLDVETEEFEEDKNEIDYAVNKVMDQIKTKIPTKNIEKVKNSVRSYLTKDDNTKEKINSNLVSAKGAEKVGIASIIYKVSGDIDKAKKITNSISKKKLLVF